MRGIEIGELIKGDNYYKARLLVFFMLMVSLPFRMNLANTLLVVSVLGALSVIYHSFRANAIEHSKLSYLFVTYFFLELIALLYTQPENLKQGLSTLEMHLAFVLVPLAFCGFPISSQQRNQLLYAFITGCFIASFFCIIANIRLSLTEGKFFHEYYFSHDRVSEPIGLQAVYFALYLSLSVIILLHLLLDQIESLSIKNRIFIGVLILFFVTVIVATGARTTIVALMLIIILNIVIYTLRRRAYKFLIVPALIPLIFVSLVLLNPVAKTRFADLRHNQTAGSNYDSYFARINIWKPGIEAIKENFWVGTGPGDQQTELNKKYKKYNYQAGVESKLNLHNQYLQTTLGLGIVGLMIFLSIFLVQLKRAIKQKDFLYMSFVFLFMCACVTESMLNRNKGIVFFLVFSFIFYKSDAIRFKNIR